jgi:hypothetical protein
MSIELELPEELENELAAEAEQLGLTLPEYALRLLSSGLLVGKKPANGAELIDYWESEGLIGARPDITDSQSYARQLRDRAEERSRP